mmetsp:Transcript_45033/g.88616  ORF Transcript_45033/g.88616 Transcript_45033/m.88616 type:complete len:143 (-) Transcript_45033:184-612(-)
MTQRICVKGVGTVFVKDAVPKLTVFWDLPPPPTPSPSSSSSSDGGGLPLPFLIGMAAGRRGGSGGDFLADANSLPFIPVAGGGTGSASSSSSSSSPPPPPSSSPLTALREAWSGSWPVRRTIKGSSGRRRPAEVSKLFLLVV